MAKPDDAASLRRRTGSIRRLDASRARELVALFTKPAVADGTGPALDRHDPIAGPTHGWVTLERPPDRAGRSVRQPLPLTAASTVFPTGTFPGSGYALGRVLHSTLPDMPPPGAVATAAGGTLRASAS